MSRQNVNLFVYGSLRDSAIFESVSGFSFSTDTSKVAKKTLQAEPVFLPNYRKLSPDNVYFYAVADSGSRIEGFVIYDVPDLAMDEIDKFEGKRYIRDIVQINTAKGSSWAHAYLVSRESMQKHFGDRFHVNLIHELWLRKRIEQFLKKNTRPGDETFDAELERRAQRELLATTERDLVMSHYHSDAVSDYYLEHELDRPRASMKHLYDDPDVRPFVGNYLRLVVKQILLNQLDEKIQTQFRFELDRMRSSERYFKRTVSILIALQILNSNHDLVEMILDMAMENIPYKQKDLIDYVKYSVNAADNIFDGRVVRSRLQRINSNVQFGIVPLGAEIELSNLGSAAVGAKAAGKKGFDPVYAGFRYFQDFGLDIMTWKLGGYIDDHSGSTEFSKRSGFLELAPGRLNIKGELSRPVTADPWLLNQLIREITLFYEVKPHSLHLSFQLRKNQIGKQRPLPLGFVKCLLVLGGGLEHRRTGRLWVSRMGYDEITQDNYGQELVFARTSRRKWYLGEDDIGDRAPKQASTQIMQYKFIRLDRRANYEPLILCLKGLQLQYNPADYLTAAQLQKNKKLRNDFEELKKWSEEPTQIGNQVMGRFIKTVQNGLMNEKNHRPAHKLHYIDWALSAIYVQLRMFNIQIKKAANASQQ